MTPMTRNYSQSRSIQSIAPISEGSGNSVDVVTDHKNLEYFAILKLLTRCQARWSGIPVPINMIIVSDQELRSKPDALTTNGDIYRKGGIAKLRMAKPSNSDLSSHKNNSPNHSRKQPSQPHSHNAIIRMCEKLHNEHSSPLPLPHLCSTSATPPLQPIGTLMKSGILISRPNYVPCG